MGHLTPVTEYTTNSPEAFDSKINAWAEGVLLTIDADKSKLTIRGTERPYASEYARMLKAIHDKTAKMIHSDRIQAASKIRLEWKGALETAHVQNTNKDRDMTFQLPGTNGKLLIVDETNYYNRVTPAVAPSNSTASLTDMECKAIQELKDLKVGECVVVGYEQGLLFNNAYTVIKVNKCHPK